MSDAPHHRSEVRVTRVDPSPQVVTEVGIAMREELPGKAGTPRKPEAVARGGAPTLRLTEPLTPRELRILGMVCDGDINREIASKLQLSANGVKYHLQNIFEKLGVSRRTHAVAVAIHAGLIAPEWLVYRSRRRR